VAPPYKESIGVEAQHDDSIQQVVREAKELIKMLEATSVQRVSLEAGAFKIMVERAVASAGAAAGAPVLAAPEKALPKDTLHRVLAPLVGTFYNAPTPGAKPFVEVGSRVQRGQAVGIIEAMKIMNEVASDVSGVVVEILLANGQPVQYEQPLIVIDPAA
jgi:acetyl-CoA carboxylase biotin carboxyl carrier protein